MSLPVELPRSTYYHRCGWRHFLWTSTAEDGKIYYNNGENSFAFSQRGASHRAANEGGPERPLATPPWRPAAESMRSASTSVPVCALFCRRPMARPLWLLPPHRLCVHELIFRALVSVLVCSVLFLTGVTGAAKPIDDVTGILRYARRYNRNSYPTQDQETPTLVTIQMYIEGMSSFRAQTMDFQVDIYFQQKWIDHRLRHNNTKRVLVKELKHLNLIWHPDLYFANARTAQFHDVTAPNFLVWIYQNGTIWYDCRISLTVICMQNLAKYPLDSQRCALRILSYAYDNEQLVIKWNSQNAIDTNDDIRMPDMRLKEIIPGQMNSTYATGVWSCATAEFFVDREIMHHLLQSYLPTSLIVVISWFNFWLDVEAVPGRVSLSITTLLTLATQSSAARMALPQASYVKAIDVWMGACMTFVFMAMIEFTVVNFCVRRKQKKKDAKAKGLSNQVHHLIEEYRNEKATSQCLFEDRMDAEPNSLLEKKSIREMHHEDCENNHNALLPTLRRGLSNRKRKIIEERISRVEENRKYAQSIDKKSRTYFPSAFILFNMAYWTYYLKIAKSY